MSRAEAGGLTISGELIQADVRRKRQTPNSLGRPYLDASSRRGPAKLHHYST